MAGKFFAIDRRRWAEACRLGMNPAVAYLVLACGTGADQRHTSWSVNAVETYTGISRGRARAAIDRLLAAGMMYRIDDGHLRYTIRPWRDGDKTPAPDWIWLPNTFVIGAAGEVPPLEKLRQGQDVMALRLAVDLYSDQNLVEDGGIRRSLIYKTGIRHHVGDYGPYTVWGFERNGRSYVTWSNDTSDPHRRQLTPEDKEAGRNSTYDFFERLRIVEAAGVLDWVPYLMESDSADAEIIHPLWGDDLERRVGQLAEEAACSMLTEGQRKWAMDQSLMLAPVLRHIANVQRFSIARLKYRPQTRATAAWWADSRAKLEAWIRCYEGLQKPRNLAKIA